jgi:hypothetical protein
MPSRSKGCQQEEKAAPVASLNGTGSGEAARERCESIARCLFSFRIDCSITLSLPFILNEYTLGVIPPQVCHLVVPDERMGLSSNDPGHKHTAKITCVFATAGNNSIEYPLADRPSRSA